MHPHERGRLLGEGAISQERADDLLDRYNHANPRDHKHHQRKRPYYPRESTREKALVARCADLVAQLGSALELMHEKDDVIAELDEANRLLSGKLRFQQKRYNVLAALRR